MTDAKPNLRSALAAAQAEVKGLVYKAGANTEQRYHFVGHEDVISHVRAAMVRHGVVIVPTGLRFVQELRWPTAAKERVAWLWEQSFDILHAQSEEKASATVQVTTMPNDKASFVASTAADRTLLMRLMRLAGTSEENPEDDSHDEDHRHQSSGAPAQHSQVRQPQGRAQATADVPVLLATLRTELAVCMDFAQLADFRLHALRKLNEAGIQGEPRQKFWQSWAERCQALKFAPADVAAAADAKARAA